MESKMKKVSLLLLVFFSVSVFGAEFKVRSFEFVQNDLSARRFSRTDVNDNVCAIIKVSCDVSGLKFDSNAGIVGEIEYKTGEYWLYVSPGEKQIDVFREGYEKLPFYISANVKSNQVYLLKIYGTGNGAMLADDNLLQLTINLNEKTVYVARDDFAPLKIKEKTAIFKLAEGIYNFKFQKTGFETLHREINLSQNKTIEITMTAGETADGLKLPGVVTITSKQENAEVFINGQLVGVTPYFDELIAGNYNLQIKKKMYHTQNLTFSVEEGVSKEIPEIVLKEKYAVISINSNPPNAVIYLNNKRIGKTPIKNKQVESGDYSINLKYDLYHEINENFTLKDGDKPNLAYNFLPAFGTLKITSQPTNAKVYIDGEMVGTTPYSNTKQLSEKYSIRVEKELWLGDEKNVLIEDDKTTEKHFTLIKNYGTLTVNSPNANIYIDNKKMGTGNISQNLTPGKYTVKATLDKHYDATKTVFIQTSDKQEITLSPEPKLGSITVMSKPLSTKGAEIFVNGKKDKKKTPAVLPLLYGNYEITLKHPKFLDMTKNISLKESEQKKIIFEMQTYEGSILAKKNFHKKQTLFGVIGSVVIAGAGAYFNVSADATYDEYADATNTDVCTEKREKYESLQSLRDVSYTVSLVPLAYSFYNFVKMKSVK
jgi:hypothetical protein